MEDEGPAECFRFSLVARRLDELSELDVGNGTNVNVIGVQPDPSDRSFPVRMVAFAVLGPHQKFIFRNQYHPFSRSVFGPKLDCGGYRWVVRLFPSRRAAVSLLSN